MYSYWNMEGPPILEVGPPIYPSPPISENKASAPPMILEPKFFSSPIMMGGGLKPWQHIQKDETALPEEMIYADNWDFLMMETKTIQHINNILIAFWSRNISSLRQIKYIIGATSRQKRRREVKRWINLGRCVWAQGYCEEETSCYFKFREN